jgi:hypothetical protein
MKLDFENLKKLASKRTIPGWIVWILIFVWRRLADIQTLQWLGGSKLLHWHPDLVNVLLFVSGLAWLTAVLLWPTKTALWLEFDETQPYSKRPLRIQNTGKNDLFEVVVRIPADGSGFVSDTIPRLPNDGTWILCSSSGTVETHERASSRIVDIILSGHPHAVLPVLVNFTGGKQQFEIRTPILHGIKFSLPTKPSVFQRLGLAR